MRQLARRPRLRREAVPEARSGPDCCPCARLTPGDAQEDHQEEARWVVLRTLHPLPGAPGWSAPQNCATQTVLLVSPHCRQPHSPFCPFSCWRRRRSSRNPRRGCRQDAEAVPIPPRHARPEGDPQVPEKHRPAGPQAALRSPGASHVSALAAAARLRLAASWLCVGDTTLAVSHP